MAHRKSKPSDPMTEYGRPIAYDREIFIAICRRLCATNAPTKGGAVLCKRWR
jgi:hypothetical protein